MYRPKGWENPYKPDNENNEYYGDIGARDQSIYEAGADAMLEGLRKVVDWGESECFEHPYNSDLPEEEYNRKRHRCIECWQSLLKETE